MKKIFLLYIVFFCIQFTVVAQCSICTKTAAQQGEMPAKALNGGIIYLMLSPLAIATYIGYRWWKREKEFLKNE